MLRHARLPAMQGRPDQVCGEKDDRDAATQKLVAKLSGPSTGLRRDSPHCQHTHHDIKPTLAKATVVSSSTKKPSAVSSAFL